MHDIMPILINAVSPLLSEHEPAMQGISESPSGAISPVFVELGS